MNAPLPPAARIPGETFADAVRDLAADYVSWGDPPQLGLLHEDAGHLRVGTILIMPVPGEMLPMTILAATAKFAQEDDDRHSLAGYVLLVEAWGAHFDADAMPAVEREQLHRDAERRALHTRPDAREIVMALACDVRGRVWYAHRFRDATESEPVCEIAAGTAPGRSLLGGDLVKAMRSSGLGTGVAIHKMPLPATN